LDGGGSGFDAVCAIRGGGSCFDGGGSGLANISI
jgi:hypothetical protein